MPHREDDMTSLPEQPPRPQLRDGVHYIPTEFGTRVRLMVISLAKREAREAVKRKLRAEGTKPWLRTVSEINRLADAHLQANAATLLAAAEASGTVRNLRLEHERRAVDRHAKSLIETPVQNGGPQ
jgi:hypothetical protein